MSMRPANLPVAIRRVLSDLEGPVLVFPVAVIALVAATYLFPGGRCGAWQWWLAVAGTAAWAFHRSGGRRRGAVAAGAFLAGVAFLWLFSNVAVVEAHYDMLRCHLPAVRLLVEGWNPVWEGTPDGIRAATGIGLEPFYTYHILAMPKGVLYFSASAWFFVRNPHNLLFPLLPVLFAATALVLLDVFRGVLSRIWRVLAIAILALCTPDWRNPLDAAVALCAVGLMASFWDWLRTGRFNALRIGVFTVMMAVAKPNGFVHAPLLWLLAVAAGALHGRIRGAPAALPVLRTAAAALALAALVSVSPYGSAWLRFGHPFYPRWTADEARFPAVNLAADFLDRNEDAASMDRATAWINACVSPRLARAIGRHRTGREDYFPEASTWVQGRHEPGTPTTASWRMAFCALLLLLLLSGRPEGRFAGLCLLAATLALPTEMIGYRRYVPWIFPAAVFALPPLRALLAWCRVPSRLADCLAAAAAVLLVASPLLRLAYYIDDARAILSLEARTPPPAAVFPADLDPGQSVLPDVSEPALRANARLLLREDPWLAGAAILGTPPADGPAAVPPPPFPRFPSNGLAVSPDCPLPDHSARYRLFACISRRDRLPATARFLLRTYFVTLPETAFLALSRPFR